MAEWKRFESEDVPTSTINSYLDNGITPKYKAYYRQKLIEHGLNGMPFETFGVSIGAPMNVVNDWLKEFPGFARAKEYYDSYFKNFWIEKIKDADKNGTNSEMVKLFAKNYLGLVVGDKAVPSKNDEVTSIIIKRASDEKCQ